MLNNLISFFTRRKQEREPTFMVPTFIDMHRMISSLLKENINIRAENEKLREALRPFGEALKDNYSMQVDELPIIAGSNQMDIRFKWTLGDLRRARAALEGVKESASPWRDIESAPKDGTPIEGSELYRYLPYKPEGRRQMKANGRWQRWNGYGWENSEQPQKWKPADKPTDPPR